MDRDRFDQLARFLGRGVHRRAALATLAALAVGGVEQATAKHKPKQKRHGRASGGNGNGGNSACAHFCAAVFGADTPAAGKCTSDAAHGNPDGLCARCGTAAPTAICCIRNSVGVCPDAAAAVCPCSTGQTCVNGVCQANACPVVSACGHPVACAPGCLCNRTIEGDNLCALSFCIGQCVPCSANNPCRSGQRCIPDTCLGNICVLPCGSDQATTAARARRRGHDQRPFARAVD